LDKVGVIHGRFQILHVGHMEYLLAGKSRCDYLLIGITNPDLAMIKHTDSNPHRSKMSSNPFTFYERFQMTKGAMLEAGVRINEFDIVPFPINHPDHLFNYVPKCAKYYMTIYDQWGIEKYELLKKLSCDTNVMWRKTNDEKVTSGSQIRRLIIDGKSWESLVPKFVYNYIIDNGLDKRIVELNLREEK